MASHIVNGFKRLDPLTVAIASVDQAFNGSRITFSSAATSFQTGLRNNLILVTGINGQIFVADEAAANAYYDLTDKILIGVSNGVVYNPRATVGSDPIYIKANVQMQPFFVTLVSGVMGFNFYLNTGDWPDLPPAGNLSLSAYLNVYFDYSFQ